VGFVRPTDTPGQALNVIYAEHIAQLVNVLTGQRDAGAMFLLAPIGAPTTAPSITLSTGSMTGSYQWGTYWISGIEDGTGTFSITGRTTPSPYSTAQTLASQQGTVSIAGETVPTGVVGWGIVRNHAGGATWYEVPGSEQFANGVGSMPTTYVDDVADTSLVTPAPATNTTGTSLSGAIDALTLGGLPSTDYLRTDAGAGAQTVADAVTFASGVSNASGQLGSASGTWTPASGSLNVAVGTVINLAAVPSGAKMYQTIDTTGHYSTMGYYTSNGIMTPAGAAGVYSYVNQDLILPYWANGISSTTGTASGLSNFAPTHVYDGSYQTDGYFQINNGYLQFVTTSATSPISANSSTVRWGVA